MYTVKTFADHFLLLYSTDVISLYCTLSLAYKHSYYLRVPAETLALVVITDYTELIS